MIVILIFNFIIAFVLAFFIYVIIKSRNVCPQCAAGGIRQHVLPGEHCPRCNHPC